jgi:hypothetical protein
MQIGKNAELREWTRQVIEKMPHLTKSQALVLAMWSQDLKDKTKIARAQLDVTTCFAPLICWVTHNSYCTPQF